MYVQFVALWHKVLEVILDAIPFLGFGAFIAGILKAFVSNNLIAKYLRRESIASPIKAALLGAPIPLCSCSVIPVAMELRRGGAGKGSLTSFLISAPETGIDSLAISYAMLGPIMLIARLVSSLCTAVLTAWSVMGFTKHIPMRPIPEEKKSCCCTKQDSDNTQNTTIRDTEKPSSILTRFIDGQRYAFTTLLDDSLKWVMIAIVTTVVINTYVPPHFFVKYGDGLLAMMVMVLVGLPLYICASASTPVAAGLLAIGVSPGAALVFMLVGPASNIVTIKIVSMLMNKTAAFVYVVGVIIVSIASGLILNVLVNTWGWDIMGQVEQVSVLPLSVAIITTLVVFVTAIKPLRPYLGLVKKCECKK